MLGVYVELLSGVRIDLKNSSILKSSRSFEAAVDVCEPIT